MIAVGQQVLPMLPGLSDRDPQKDWGRWSGPGLRGKRGRSKALTEEEGVCGESTGEDWEEFKEVVVW